MSLCIACYEATDKEKGSRAVLRSVDRVPVQQRINHYINSITVRFQGPGISILVPPTPTQFDNHSTMEAPLTAEEQYLLAHQLHQRGEVYHPVDRYMAELSREMVSLRSLHFTDSDIQVALDFIAGEDGTARMHVIARNRIRKRWEQLGVWNPQWGIPFQLHQQPNDDWREWKWKWQKDDHAAEWHDGPGFEAMNAQHPITRAVNARGGLSRREVQPLTPRESLKENASADEAEAFIISRPWSTFQVEIGEERLRTNRAFPSHVPYCDEREDTVTPRWELENAVTRRWERRGRWRGAWYIRGLSGGRGRTVGWKWQHETASPDQEKLRYLNSHFPNRHSLNMEGDRYTPSEKDALEATFPMAPTYRRWADVYPPPPPSPPPDQPRHRDESPEDIVVPPVVGEPGEPGEPGQAGPAQG